MKAKSTKDIKNEQDAAAAEIQGAAANFLANKRAPAPAPAAMDVIGNIGGVIMGMFSNRPPEPQKDAPTAAPAPSPAPSAPAPSPAPSPEAAAPLPEAAAPAAPAPAPA